MQLCWEVVCYSSFTAFCLCVVVAVGTRCAEHQKGEFLPACSKEQKRNNRLANTETRKSGKIISWILFRARCGLLGQFWAFLSPYFSIFKPFRAFIDHFLSFFQSILELKMGKNHRKNGNIELKMKSKHALERVLNQNWSKFDENIHKNCKTALIMVQNWLEKDLTRRKYSLMNLKVNRKPKRNTKSIECLQT